jgi:UDP-N-acetylmuramoyl-tripeptide--D-alanyl-D-alanine ligase
VLVVHDTRAALGLLARAWRRAWGGTVVAVGGSNGKTSTKEMLRAVLGARLHVHATAFNQNNLIGVPLTLLSVPAYAHVAVVEVGTNAPGEIAQLRAICEPDIAVVTSIGEEHLEGLGDLAGVLREEAALFPDVPLAVVPEHENELQEAARAHGVARVIRAGLEQGDVHADSWSMQPDGYVSLQIQGTAVTVPMRGQHHAANAMLALAVGEALGVPVADAAQALSRMQVPAMRGGWETVGSLTIINDAYNANPPSIRAALALLTQVGAQRQRVAVLGTMRELGLQSDAQHDAIARDAIAALNAGVDIMIAVGEFAKAFARVAPNDVRVRSAADTDEAWAQMDPVLSRDAMVLLKGSRGVQLERLLPQLTSWAMS